MEGTSVSMRAAYRGVSSLYASIIYNKYAHASSPRRAAGAHIDMSFCAQGRPFITAAEGAENIAGGSSLPLPSFRKTLTSRYASARHASISLRLKPRVVEAFTTKEGPSMSWVITRVFRRERREVNVRLARIQNRTSRAITPHRRAMGPLPGIGDTYAVDNRASRFSRPEHSFEVYGTRVNTQASRFIKDIMARRSANFPGRGLAASYYRRRAYRVPSFERISLISNFDKV